jgi:hypothetical protein
MPFPLSVTLVLRLPSWFSDSRRSRSESATSSILSDGNDKLEELADVAGRLVTLKLSLRGNRLEDIVRC